MTTLGQSEHRKAAFLEAFRVSGNVSQAAKAAGCGRTTVYGWQEHDETFALAYRQAELEAVDVLEAEARRRALGYETTVLDNHGHAHPVTRYSDLLLIFLLKGARPEKYRDNAPPAGAPETVRSYAGVDWERI